MHTFMFLEFIIIISHLLNVYMKNYAQKFPYNRLIFHANV